MDHGLGEPLQARVQLVVPVEADRQGRAADQGHPQMHGLWSQLSGTAKAAH